MKERLWRSTFARVTAVVVAVALLPLPVLAAEKGAPLKPGKTLSASITSAAAREARAATRTGSATQDQQGTTKNPDLGTWGFFKTPLGLGVAALFAAGTGYAIYSWRHDRITAPGRSGGLK